jgi:hypothetical protein
MQHINWDEDFVTVSGISNDGVRYRQNGINYNGQGEAVDKKQVQAYANRLVAEAQAKADEAMAVAKALHAEAIDLKKELGIGPPAKKTAVKKKAAR